MRLSEKLKEQILIIVSIFLILLSFISLIIMIAYFQTHTEENVVSHKEFYVALSGIGFSLVTIVGGIWAFIAHKMIAFSNDMNTFKLDIQKELGRFISEINKELGRLSGIIESTRSEKDKKGS